MSPALSIQLPIDYYRILGLPPQCDSPQVAAAYTDRMVQSPRPEFSAQIRSQREALLSAAYETLNDPKRRSEYDRNLSGRLDFDEDCLAAGLLMLYELGEYQSIIEREDEILSLCDSSDLRLVIALAHRSMADEAHRQGNLTVAFSALEAAIDRLRSGDLLPAVQQEFQALLRQWRPEWILQQLAGAPTSESPQRYAGLKVFQAMLDERGGLEGEGNDGSGLSREEFVQFMQYVRLRLIVAEQQDLFEHEATRPSPAAQYLAAQALLARGFTQSEPGLIRRARGYLISLSQRQDVNLELAVCSLLLGQTEEALKGLERSQEEQPVSYIRAISTGAPDLLPGLCRYSEEWLADEVFAGFRNLRQTPARLQSYFSSPEVQTYLDSPESPKTPPAPLPPPEHEPVRLSRRRAYPSPFILAGASLVAVFLLGSGWLFTRRSATEPVIPVASQASVPPQVATVRPAPAPPPAATGSASTYALLSGWQKAKQQVLGPEYRTEAMLPFLTRRLRDQWTERAQRSRQAGEHWQFRLKKLEIERIEVSAERQMRVIARVEEVANFYSDRQRQSSRSYDRPYRVRYGLVREPSGWRITEMKVI